MSYLPHTTKPMSPTPTFPTSTGAAKICIGIIGGLGALAGADVHGKLLRSIAAGGHASDYAVLYEQHPFQGEGRLEGGAPELAGRMLYIYDMLQRYEGAGAHCAMLPCFISHTFLHQLRIELRLPIISLMDALLAALRQNAPAARTVGVLTSDYVLGQRLFERHLEPAGYRVLYPSPQVQRDRVMEAVYGQAGLKAHDRSPGAVALLLEACRSLMAQGADLIVPGTTEIAMIASLLNVAGIPAMDSNQAYVDYALAIREQMPPQSFKIGIIGGVGPAATVDFMDKIIVNTSADRDQEHVKLIVEHNPQIPDRTANLIGDGEDPTLAIYAACKRLEANHADLIAIPCNTAHAYLQRISAQVAVPIINMLHETVHHITRHHPEHRRVGLLATSGTIQSRVYHDAAAGASFELLVPDQAHQALVMRAIYGERGIKAGYLEGECRADLMLALNHLVQAGASVVILGCTELPLLLREDAAFPLGERRIVLLDPTAILARRCVELARGGA
ncbi:aspartate/glutamate racemase family protein [Rugamonas brunnea]|nr:amino acid racemase [Rugamonas brunnea]